MEPPLQELAGVTPARRGPISIVSRVDRFVPMPLPNGWGFAGSARLTRLLPPQRIFPGDARALAPPGTSRPRKISDVSCESGLFSVAYESAEGKFIRP
jgi:hypothetical protein